MFRALARRMIVIGMLAGFFAETASAQQPIRSQLLVPDDLQLSIMIKTALIAFNNANLTGNYSVLRDLAAPSFREANSQARLAEIFQKPRKDKLNIAPIVLYKPVLSRKPWINDRRLLRLQGVYDTRPEQVKFNLAYTAVGNQWRLFAIGVTTAKPQASETSDEKATEPLNKRPNRKTTGNKSKRPLQNKPASGPVNLLPRQKPTSK